MFQTLIYFTTQGYEFDSSIMWIGTTLYKQCLLIPRESMTNNSISYSFDIDMYLKTALPSYPPVP